MVEAQAEGTGEGAGGEHVWNAIAALPPADLPRRHADAGRKLVLPDLQKGAERTEAAGENVAIGHGSASYHRTQVASSGPARPVVRCAP